MSSTLTRIAPVDGLRAVAVLGVLWAHVWMFAGTPSLSIGNWGTLSLDLQRVLALMGTGVDLFFVLSGFCMYFMYLRRHKAWSVEGSLTFIQRRWLRLAPAFYTAVLASALGLWLYGLPFPWRELMAHLTFTHMLVPGTGDLAAPFWSLATEWQFYLILPLVLSGVLRWGFRPVLFLLMAGCIVFRLWAYRQSDQRLLFLSHQMPPRLIEFCWGMWVARWMEDKKSLSPLLRGNRGFLVALSVVLGGRFLMCDEFSHWAGRWGFLSLVAWEPILSLGYALMLWNVIASPSLFSSLLSSAPAQAIGRWSYSLYLWHWWPCYAITRTVTSHLGETLLAQYLSLGLLLLFLLPVGALSYQWLEAPYFRKERGTP